MPSYTRLELLSIRERMTKTRNAVQIQQPREDFQMLKSDHIEKAQEKEASNSVQIFTSEMNEIWKNVRELHTKVEQVYFQGLPESFAGNKEQSLQIFRDANDNLKSFSHQMHKEFSSILTTVNIMYNKLQKQVLEKQSTRTEYLANFLVHKKSNLQQVREKNMQLQKEVELSKKYWLELTRIVQAQQQLKDNSDQKVSCSICMDEWKLSGDHRVVSLKCGHLFGDKCVRRSLEEREICPQCRAPAALKDIRIIYGSPY